MARRRSSTSHAFFLHLFMHRVLDALLALRQPTRGRGRRGRPRHARRRPRRDERDHEANSHVRTPNLVITIEDSSSGENTHVSPMGVGDGNISPTYTPASPEYHPGADSPERPVRYTLAARRGALPFYVEPGLPHGVEPDYADSEPETPPHRPNFIRTGHTPTGKTANSGFRRSPPPGEGEA